jgi:hypothetical protein
MRIREWTALLLAAGGASCAGAPAEGPSELRLRAAGPLDSRFVHLRPDGTFQFYFRAHFATREGLRGTWRPTGPDAAALRCDRWSRQVVSDAFRVRFGAEWEGQRARVLEAVETLLRDHPAQARFTREELENTGTWDEERELVTGREMVTVVPISVLEESVPRADVEKLVAAIGAYERLGDPHEVHLRLHRHRGVEFAEWTDWSAYEDPVPLASIREEIDRLAPGETLADVWVTLEKEAFEQELFQGRSFKFFKRPARDR